MNQPPRTKQQMTWLAVFRQATARGAQIWLDFIRGLAHLDQAGRLAAFNLEYANIEKALGLTLHDPVAWPVASELIAALWPYVEARGFWQRWQDILEQALSMARQCRTAGVEADLLGQYGSLMGYLSDYARAVTCFEEALQLYRDLDNLPGIASIQLELGEAYANVTRYEDALAACRQAASRFEELDDVLHLGRAHNTWGVVYKEMRNWEEALPHLRSALALAEQSDDLLGKAQACNNLGNVHRQLEKFTEASAYFDEAIQFYEAIGNVQRLTTARLNQAIIWHEQGDSARALVLYRQASPVIRQLRDRAWLARIANNEGVFMVNLGWAEEAEEAFREAVKLHKATGDFARAADSLHNMVNQFLTHDLPIDVIPRLDEALELLQKLTEIPPHMLERNQTLRATVLSFEEKARPRAARHT